MEMLIDVAEDASKQGKEHTDGDQSARNNLSDIATPALRAILTTADQRRLIPRADEIRHSN